MAKNILINFDSRVRSLLILSATLFCLLVVFKIHYSSIHCWDDLVSQAGVRENSGLLFGKPRGIRSDEWQVVTPSLMSQAHRHPSYPLENEGLGAGRIPLIMNLPVKHFSIFFKPQYWGFFVFDLERGFSFYWNYKVFGMILAFFLLLMLLTGNDFWLSLFGSIWLFLSSFVQWWFSGWVPELILSFSLIFIAIIYIIYSSNKYTVIISYLLLLFFGINFILFFYPPYQISLIYLLIFLLVGYCLRNYQLINFRKILPYKIFGLLCLLMVSFIFFFYFYRDASETINMIRSTVYPGNRLTTGGHVSIKKFFYGFYDLWLNQINFPAGFINACEASNFLLFFPIITMLYLNKIIRYPQSYSLEICIILYLSFISIWILVGFHQIVAKALLLDVVPSNRAFIGLGVANIILSIIYLSDKDDKNTISSYYPSFNHIIILGTILVAIILLGISVGRPFWQIIISSISIPFLTYCLLYKRRLLFCGLLLFFFLLLNLRVNPLARTLNPIYQKNIYKYVYQINQEDPDAKWIVFGKETVANLLRATGINIFNGVKHIPDIEQFRLLDPSSKNKNIYNRFAHIQLISNENDELPIFNLYLVDKYAVKINPCSNILKKLHIKYFVFTYLPPINETHCLDYLASFPDSEIYIFTHK